MLLIVRGRLLLVCVFVHSELTWDVSTAKWPHPTVPTQRQKDITKELQHFLIPPAIPSSRRLEYIMISSPGERPLGREGTGPRALMYFTDV
jgi:hypothetical protein